MSQSQNKINNLILYMKARQLNHKKQLVGNSISNIFSSKMICLPNDLRLPVVQLGHQVEK